MLNFSGKRKLKGGPGQEVLQGSHRLPSVVSEPHAGQPHKPAERWLLGQPGWQLHQLTGRLLFCIPVIDEP